MNNQWGQVSRSSAITKQSKQLWNMLALMISRSIHGAFEGIKIDSKYEILYGVTATILLTTVVVELLKLKDPHNVL